MLVQAVGRALRRPEGKTHVIVNYCLADNAPVLKSQYTRRRTADTGKTEDLCHLFDSCKLYTWQIVWM